MGDYLDHIIWACDDLERGSAQFESLTGVRPRYGGVHSSGVTHNALVGLTGHRYLEILAPVKTPRRDDNQWARLAREARDPRVLTYCLRSAQPLAELASVGAARGWENAEVTDNARTTPDGVRLRWQWLTPNVKPFGLGFPFFIDWLDSPHPSVSLQPARPEEGVRLRSFAVGHADSEKLHRVLSELGFSIETYPADGLQFRVLLDTPKGSLLL